MTVPVPPATSLPRVVDAELTELLADAPAVVVEGARGVGKTATASRLARSVVDLDRPLERERVVADPRGYLESHDPPVLIDEWQLEPAAWDGARRSMRPLDDRALAI